MHQSLGYGRYVDSFSRSAPRRRVLFVPLDGQSPRGSGGGSATLEGSAVYLSRSFHYYTLTEKEAFKIPHSREEISFSLVFVVLLV